MFGTLSINRNKYLLINMSKLKFKKEIETERLILKCGVSIIRSWLVKFKLKVKEIKLLIKSIYIIYKLECVHTLYIPQI